MSSNLGLSHQATAGGVSTRGIAMVWRRYPFESLWRKMKQIRADQCNPFHQTAPGNQLHLPGGFTDRMLPAIRGEFRVDVREDEDEVIVVTDVMQDNSRASFKYRVLEVTLKR